MQGDNGDLFPEILRLHFPQGGRVLDTIYRKGTFWKGVDMSKITLDKLKWEKDKADDYRNLPARVLENQYDIVVHDPDYTHDAATFGGANYSNQTCEGTKSGGHRALVVNNYYLPAREILKVLKKGGLLVVKTQDEICSKKYRSTSGDITKMLHNLGLVKEDEFAILQKNKPSSARWKNVKQQHARKNHSVFLVYKYRPVNQEKHLLPETQNFINMRRNYDHMISMYMRAAGIAELDIDTPYFSYLHPIPK